jgi:hypothetical protein
VTANRWNRILRREFGWSRLDEPPEQPVRSRRERVPELASPVGSWASAWPALS